LSAVILGCVVTAPIGPDADLGFALPRQPSLTGRCCHPSAARVKGARSARIPAGKPLTRASSGRRGTTVRLRRRNPWHQPVRKPPARFSHSADGCIYARRSRPVSPDRPAGGAVKAAAGASDSELGLDGGAGGAIPGCGVRTPGAAAQGRSKPETPADQGECPYSPLEPVRVRTNSDTSAGQGGYCGVSAVIRSKSGIVRLAWFRCDSLHCRTCGPRVRAERVKLYAEAIGRTPVMEYDLTGKAWPTLQRRLERGKADYLRVPTRSGALVLATHGPDRPVDNVVWWLEDALDQLIKGPRISTSRRWALVRRQEVSGWTLVGISYEGPHSMAQAAAVSVGLDADDRLVNADDPVLWSTFCGVVGLHLPSRRRWGERAEG
jgi:hypothetical protein